MGAKSLLWLLVFCSIFIGNFSTTCTKPNDRKCRITRVRGLKASDCYGMNLEEFPKCLPSNIEVVELSYNRITEVSREDLRQYPFIAHLYLMDNFMENLEDDTFKDLTNLETLDLSRTRLKKVPASVFQLPSLKTLYLSHNININIAESIEQAKPISQNSLTKLHISHITKQGYSIDFPDFSEFPYLALLNISENNFNNVSTRHFAGLCNLQILESVNVTAEFENDCDCWKINRWLTERNVQFTKFLCPVIETECMDQQIGEEDSELYRKCKVKFENIERSMLLRKIGLWIGISLVVIAVLAAIFGYRKWKKSREARTTTLNQVNHPPLLNNQSKV